MADAIISDWLAEYSILEPDEIKAFAANHANNHEISTALFTIFNERNKYPDLLHSICNQLHSFYRSNEAELRRFTLQFVPILIYIYLNSVAHGERKSSRNIETLLLCIYNFEISKEDGQPKTVAFRMPVLAQTSIYHEEKSLQTSDLKRWEEYCNKEITWGPCFPVESLNAQNRQKVMTALLFMYNQQLSLIQKVALYHLCKVGSQLVTQGFSKFGHAHRSSYGSDPTSAKPPPRIALSSQLLLELLNATYFAMFNEFASAAIQAVDDIHMRAAFEMYADVLIVTNAIKNSLQTNPSGQPSDGPMGISVALSPATTTVTVSKSMITNASFRAKKLPDDIPIQAEDGQQQQLVSITEEGEGGGGGAELANVARNSVSRSSKDGPKIHKIPFSGHLRKFKEREPKTVARNGVAPEPPARESLSKKFLGKDKLIGGKMSASVDAGDTEKSSSSPLAILKRKSSSMEVSGNTPATNPEALANGTVINETLNSADQNDAEPDLSQTQLEMKPANATHGSIQVSQV